MTAQPNDTGTIHALRTVTAPDPGPPPPLTPSAARLVRAMRNADSEDRVVRATRDLDPSWGDLRLARAFMSWAVALAGYQSACADRITDVWDAVDPAHEATVGDVAPLAITRGLITEGEVDAALGGNPFDILDEYAGVA